jgi:hypothetical protein
LGPVDVELPAVVADEEGDGALDVADKAGALAEIADADAEAELAACRGTQLAVIRGRRVRRAAVFILTTREGDR